MTTEPRPVLDRVITKASGAANFDVGDNGSLIYMPGTGNAATVNERRLVWVDREGQEERLEVEARSYYIVRISPDGTAVAIDVREPEVAVWIYDIAGRNLRRLTEGPGNSYPVWTPDGTRVVWGTTRGDGGAALFWRGADGTGQEELLATSASGLNPVDVSADGRQLLVRGGFVDYDIGVLSLTDEAREIEWLLETPFSERNAMLSPDGRWMAYTSDQSGRSEVWVRPFPDVEAGQRPVSQSGGGWPVWAPTTNELFYLTPEAGVCRQRRLRDTRCDSEGRC